MKSWVLTLGSLVAMVTPKLAILQDEMPKDVAFHQALHCLLR